MKFTSYSSRLQGKTAYIFGGQALDVDTEGGLEVVMNRFIDQGARRIVLTMRGMKFLHSTLFASLLAIQTRLDNLGGDLVLAEVPWFAKMTLEDIGVLHRFAIVPDELTVSRAEAISVNLDTLVIPG